MLLIILEILITIKQLSNLIIKTGFKMHNVQKHIIHMKNVGTSKHNLNMFFWESRKWH